MKGSKVFFDVMASLDGFAAPEGMDMAQADDPDYQRWMSKWTELTKWVFQQEFFHKNDIASKEVTHVTNEVVN
jgi:hypothetical protein